MGIPTRTQIGTPCVHKVFRAGQSPADHPSRVTSDEALSIEGILTGGWWQMLGRPLLGYPQGNRGGSGDGVVVLGAGMKVSVPPGLPETVTRKDLTQPN